MEDDAPATTGEVRISHSPFAASTLFSWPISPASTDTPSTTLLVRQRSDGQIFLSIDLDWNESFED